MSPTTRWWLLSDLHLGPTDDDPRHQPALRDPLSVCIPPETGRNSQV